MGKTYTLKVGDKTLVKSDLSKLYDEYNEMYFDVRLGKCGFFWLNKSEGDLGTYHFQNGKSSIGISRNVGWTENTLKEVIVHEMVHMYVTTIDNVEHDGVLGHGRHFKKQCKRLRDDFGLIIPIHSTLKNKEGFPQNWFEKILLWLIDR